MTGGVGVVLGPVGAVVGSGMTGGVVWLYDGESQAGSAGDRLHKESVSKAAPTAEDLAALRGLVEEHARQTGSRRASALLADWDSARLRFVKVVPSGADAPQVTVVTPDQSLVQIGK
jgi:glutamate synthase (NADPH/NADH) large chain